MISRQNTDINFGIYKPAIICTKTQSKVSFQEIYRSGLTVKKKLLSMIFVLILKK